MLSNKDNRNFIGRKLVLVVTIFLLGFTTFYATIHREEVGAQSEPSNVSVQTQTGESVAEGLEERVKLSWPWYLTRASGMVAAISLVILMLSGIGMITGRTFGFLEPITAWASHRALGITFGISVLIHVGALLFDHFVPFGLIDILVPFASDFKMIEILGINIGSLYVALGVLSLYLTAAVVITSLVWVNTKTKLWKFTHITSYLVMLFVFVHALYLGTDLSSGLVRWIWIAAGSSLAIFTITRFWRAYSV